MRRNFRSLRLAVSGMLVLACGIQGCKTGSDSDAASLDNFARRKGMGIEQNVCGVGTPEVAAADTAFIDSILDQGSNDPNAALVDFIDSANAAADKEALRQAMKSVPSVILGAFFSLGGKISVRQDTNAVCSTAYANLKDPLKFTFEGEGNAQIDSCVREHAEPLKVDNEEVLVTTNYLYLTSKPEGITHAFVRGIAFALFDKLSHVDLNAEKTAYTFDAPTDAGFAAFNEDITKSLLIDTMNNPKFDLSLYKDFLGNVLAAKTESSRLEAWSQFATKDPSTARNLRGYVFAESFDSYYCSDTTRTSMQTNFPKTFASFNTLVKGVEQLKSSLVAVDEASQLEKTAQGTIDASSGSTGLAGSFSTDFGPAPKVLANIPEDAPQLSLGFFGIFGGIGRAIGGVARGAGRIVVGVGQGAGRIVAGAGRALVNGAGRVVAGIGKVAVGVVRATGQVVRGAGRVAVGLARGTGRVVGAVVQGGAQLIGGAARATGRALGWTVMSTGRVVHGFFGAFAYLAGCNNPQCTSMGLAAGDYDFDGVADASDLCANTGSAVAPHTSGQYMGCASGQYLDATLAQMMVTNGYEPTADTDGDGIPNDEDLCSGTPKGAPILKQAEWKGCATNQRRDDDLLNQIAKKQNL